MSAPWPVPAVDPTGPLIVEVRSYLQANGWASVKVASELQAGWGPIGGLVLIEASGGNPRRRVPLQDIRFTARCYGPAYLADEETPDVLGRQKAMALAQGVVAATHERGPRMGSSNRPIHWSAVLQHSTSSRDPDTKWPYVVVTIQVTAGLMPLT